MFHDESLRGTPTTEEEVVRFKNGGMYISAAIVMASGIALIVHNVSASDSSPAISMSGNSGKCSLSSKKTFRMKLSGWKPNSDVQIKIFYADGTNYPFALRNHGVVKVDGNGNYNAGRPWPCWPNPTYPVPDKLTTYTVVAFQLPGTLAPIGAFSAFQVVK